MGRLNHASFVLPVTRHFMGRLRDALTPRLHKAQAIRLDTEAVEDLKLWKEILLRVHAGVSINLIVTREPDRICWSDACPLLWTRGLQHLGKSLAIADPQRPPPPRPSRNQQPPGIHGNGR